MMTHAQIYRDFCNWSPNYATMIQGFLPWGSTSIVIWLSNGKKYKVKQHSESTYKFTVQEVTDMDIEKKGIKLP